VTEERLDGCPINFDHLGADHSMRFAMNSFDDLG